MRRNYLLTGYRWGMPHSKAIILEMLFLRRAHEEEAGTPPDATSIVTYEFNKNSKGNLKLRETAQCCVRGQEVVVLQGMEGRGQKRLLPPLLFPIDYLMKLESRIFF